MKKKNSPKVYKSEAQRQKLREMAKEGLISMNDLAVYERNSEKLKLPDRVVKRSK